jgi:hypothetical protein
MIQFGIVVAIACSALWKVILDPDTTLFIRFLQVIFPILDLVVAAMALLVAKESGQFRWLIGAAASLIIGITDLVFPYFDHFNSPVYRYLDIPLFVGYSLWFLQAMALAAGLRPAVHDAGANAGAP